MKILLSTKNPQENIGKNLGVSCWVSIDQSQIDMFAKSTHDHQFIHIDQERAKAGPFGSTIAHGFLSLSLLSFMFDDLEIEIESAQMGLNYGFDKVRFITPVKVNSRVRLRSKLLDFQEKSPNQFLLRQEAVVEIEGEDKPALIAEWLTMAITA